MSYTNGAAASEPTGTIVLVSHTVLGGHDGPTRNTLPRAVLVIEALV